MNQINTSLKVSILLLQSFHLPYHFILQSPALQFLAYTLNIKTHHTTVNFIFARLWNPKALPSVHGHLRNVQILYVHISSSSKSPTFHCQMLFFIAGLPDEWRRIFHQWATFYRVGKKKSPQHFYCFLTNRISECKWMNHLCNDWLPEFPCHTQNRHRGCDLYLHESRER